MESLKAFIENHQTEIDDICTRWEEKILEKDSLGQFFDENYEVSIVMQPFDRSETEDDVSIEIITKIYCHGEDAMDADQVFDFADFVAEELVGPEMVDFFLSGGIEVGVEASGYLNDVPTWEMDLVD